TATHPLIAPFDLPGDGRGLLLLHGFGGSPFSMRELAARLQARGFTISVPMLPGHAGGPEELDRTTWRAWAGGAADSLAALRRRCPRVAVVGLPMGGLLPRPPAQHNAELAAVAALSPPISLPLWARVTARTLGAMGVAYVPKVGGSDIAAPLMRRVDPA